MADNKKLVPLAGLGILVFFLMGSKKSNAKSSSGTTTPGGNIPGPMPDSDPSKPANTDIPTTKPKDNSGPTPEKAASALERQNAAIVINSASIIANTLIPEEYGVRKGQSDLDWGTNLVFWVTYCIDKEFCPTGDANIGCSATYGGPLVPFKLKEGMKKVDGKGYAYWSKVWLRIRDYMKSQYNLSGK